MSETDTDAVALRREWEAQQLAAVIESRQRYRADLKRRDELEAKADQLRGELGSRLIKLMEDLDPYVDGTMGEITAAMAGVYLKAARELASLYELTRAQRPVVSPLPLPEPPPVADPGDEVERRRVAVEAARAEGLRQLAVVREKMTRQLGA
jgi:hypothetical protein